MKTSLQIALNDIYNSSKLACFDSLFCWDRKKFISLSPQTKNKDRVDFIN